MNEKELRRLLVRGETDVLEFKENPNESFFKNISAFANTKGGMIIPGADNKVGKIPDDVFNNMTLLRRLQCKQKF